VLVERLAVRRFAPPSSSARDDGCCIFRVVRSAGHCTAGCGVREALLVHAPMSRERDEIAPE
jgi:hypothetical protein